VLVLGVDVSSWMGRVNAGGMEDWGAAVETGFERAGVEPMVAVDRGIAAVEGSLLHFYNMTGPGVMLTGSGVVGRVGCLSGLQHDPRVHNTAARGCSGLKVVNWVWMHGGGLALWVGAEAVGETDVDQPQLTAVDSRSYLASAEVEAGADL
jgi:hypothetical protein